MDKKTKRNYPRLVASSVGVSSLTAIPAVNKMKLHCDVGSGERRDHIKQNNKSGSFGHMTRVKLYDQTLSTSGLRHTKWKEASYFSRTILVKGKLHPIYVVVKDTEIGLCTQIEIRGCENFTAGWIYMLSLGNSNECLRMVTEIGRIEPSVCAIQVPEVVTYRSM